MGRNSRPVRYRTNEKLIRRVAKKHRRNDCGQSGSVQYAMEGPEWNNSVFAYAFLKGIRERQADLNYDGAITISELQEYLPRKVSQLTRGGQLPTYRYENIQNNWRIW